MIAAVQIMVTKYRVQDLNDFSLLSIAAARKHVGVPFPVRSHRARPSLSWCGAAIFSSYTKKERQRKGEKKNRLEVFEL